MLNGWRSRGSRMKRWRREDRSVGISTVLAICATSLAVGVSSAPASLVTAGIPGYGYEMVSPASTAGQEPLAVSIGATGEDVMFNSGGGFVDVENLVSVGTMYRAHRTDDGWTTVALGGPPAVDYPSFSGIDVDWQPDWWRDAQPFSLWGATSVAEAASGAGFSVVRGYKGGPWDTVTPILGSSASVWATSSDLSAVLIAAGPASRLSLTDGTTDTRITTNPLFNTLSVVSRTSDGTIDVRQVARTNDGTTVVPTCGLAVGGLAGTVTRGAVNRDGLSRVVFTTGGSGACGNGVNRRVFVAEPYSSGPGVVDVSASRCSLGSPACGSAAAVVFVGGATDASRLYMTTTQRLLDDDVHAGADLYEYDYRRAPADRLRLVTGNPTAAQVLGVVAVSDTGSHVYFVASGALAHDSGDVGEPVPGGRNLYVRTQGDVGEAPTTRFIASLDAGDSNLWTNPGLAQAALTPDGRYLAFTAVSRLTADDQDSFRDVYRYDARTGALDRGWPSDPAMNGTNRSAGSVMKSSSWRGAIGNFGRTSSSPLPQIADDGSVIGFTSSQALLPEDVNAKDDAFVWTAATGEVAMISDGKDLRGVVSGGMSADGKTHVFMTVSKMTHEHVASSAALYAYRDGGGFSPPVAPPAPCTGDECQDPATLPKPFGDRVGTTTDLGFADVVPSASPASAPKVSVAGRRTVSGASIRLGVRVSSAGQVRVSGSGLRGTERRASKSGAHQLRVSLTERARRTLERRGRFSTTVRVALRVPGKRTVVTRAKLTFVRTAARTRSMGSPAGDAVNRTKGGR